MSSRPVNEYFSYQYPQDVVDQINAIRDRVMGPMPDRKEWMNDEVHTTGVFVGSDRHLTEDELVDLESELSEHISKPIEFTVAGPIAGIKPVILLELEYASPESECAYIGAYRAIFSFLNKRSFPSNMSFASLDSPPTRHITLSWVPSDKVEEYLTKFQEDQGVKALMGKTISTKSFRLVHNDGVVVRTFNDFK